MTEVEWLEQEKGLQASAWRQLRDLFLGDEWAASNAGYRNLADVAKLLKSQQIRIYEVIGDCPIG